MKKGALRIAFAVGGAIAVGALVGCSSTAREKKKPSVAIVISVGKGERPSPSSVTEAHQLLQPEIERRGYVMAESARTAGYFVHVRLPLDPLDVRNIPIVEAAPTVPFLKNDDWQPEVLGNRDYKRAMADMVTEPK